MPQVFDWRNATEQQAGLGQAVQALAEGRLVAFPTEAVYGVAASALDAAAVERLAQYHAQAGGGPLPLVIGSPADLDDWVPGVSALGRRLARRCWPGPVTLVCGDGTERGLAERLPGEVRERVGPEGALGLRVPEHDALHEAARRLPGPLVLAELGRNGSAATTAEQALRAAEGLVDLVIDDGPSRYGRPATVVRVGEGGWRVLHEGAWSAADLELLTARVIIFVCTGNTCRSPLAEGLCKKLLAERLGCLPEELPRRGYIILSAGLAALTGDRAAAEAVEVARENGVDLSGHASQFLTADLASQADHLIAMTQVHAAALAARYGGYGPPPRLLGEEGCDIADPIGGDLPVYRECAQQILRHLERTLPEIQQ